MRDGQSAAQATIDSSNPGLQRTRSLRVEMHDLRNRMHAGVGPSRADRVDRLLRDRAQRLLEFVLQSQTIGLRLPADALAAVVVQSKREARHLNSAS